MMLRLWGAGSGATLWRPRARKKKSLVSRRPCARVHFRCAGEDAVWQSATHLQPILGDHEELQGAGVRCGGLSGGLGCARVPAVEGVFWGLRLESCVGPRRGLRARGFTLREPHNWLLVARLATPAGLTRPALSSAFPSSSRATTTSSWASTPSCHQGTRLRLSKRRSLVHPDRRRHRRVRLYDRRLKQARPRVHGLVSSSRASMVRWSLATPSTM